MEHKFKKLTHCQYTGRELDQPEYLYRGCLFKSEPWKNCYGHWVAIERESGKRFTHNTRKMVKFHLDNFLDGAQS